MGRHTSSAVSVRAVGLIGRNSEDLSIRRESVLLLLNVYKCFSDNCFIDKISTKSTPPPTERPLILRTLIIPAVNAIKYLIDKVCLIPRLDDRIHFNQYVICCAERLASHMASHRPHRCTITNCGKEFKFKAHLARHCATAHGLAMRSGSPRPIMKTRAAFYLCATLAARVARRLCSKVLKPRHATRNPFLPININAIRLECKLLSNPLTFFRFLF